MRKAVAIDLGGTTIKFGLVNEMGEILHRLELPTPVKEGGDAIVHAMADGVYKLLNQYGAHKDEILGVGLGAPGYLDKEAGVVMRAPNLGWYRYPVKQKMEELLGLPVLADNDANLAAVGEAWKGAGEGARNLIMVTLGTGVGGGIIINGEVISGTNGIGGEIGHMVVNPKGIQCGCGLTGCLETESSATAIKRKVATAIEQGASSSLASLWKKEGHVSAKAVAEAAMNGDELALKVLDEVAYYMAFGLGSLINALNPEKILLGGGVSGSGDLLIQPLHTHLKGFALPEALEVLVIDIATLGNDAGMIGAAGQVFRRLS